MAEQSAAPEFAIRVGSLEELFEPLDARRTAERRLTEAVRDHLLDEWEWVREAPPQALRVYAPADERSDTDEDAVRAAIHHDLRAFCGPLRHARPVSRHYKIEMRLGILLLLGSIVVSTLLDRLSEAVLVEGVAQGILIVGWVALWSPAQYVALEAIPHAFNRRRYAEFAGVDVEFVWT
jgi:hypothetical protein